MIRPWLRKGGAWPERLGPAHPKHGDSLPDRWRVRESAVGDALSEHGFAGAPWTDLPSDVVVERDLAYGPETLQTLDVYRSRLTGSSSTLPVPVLVVVHGGGWTFGDKAAVDVVKNKALAWVRQGFLMVSVNHRLLPSADPVQQADDVAMALTYVQTHACDWGADVSRIGLLGHSAGAHLILLVSSDPSIMARSGGRPWSASVALDSAAYDVEAIMTRQHLPFYDRVFGHDPAYWRDASPQHRLQTRPAVPMLLVCSSRQRASLISARAYAQKVNVLGGRADVLAIDLDHRSINADLGTDGPYTAAVERFFRDVGLRC